MSLSIIVAMDDNQLIGANNTLPWHLPADLTYFKKITTNKTILMGRKTYESIGRPLTNRRNIVVSSNPNFKADGCEIANNIKSALELAKKNNKTEIIVIGGATFYKQTLKYANRLYITRVFGSYTGDTYFPKFNKNEYKTINCERHEANKINQYSYCFTVLEKNTLH